MPGRPWQKYGAAFPLGFDLYTSECIHWCRLEAGSTDSRSPKRVRNRSMITVRRWLTPPKACSLTDIYQIRLVPHVKVMHDGSLVKMCQLSHVIGLIELCWVDFVNIFDPDFPLLPSPSVSMRFPCRLMKRFVHCRLRIAQAVIHPHALRSLDRAQTPSRDP